MGNDNAGERRKEDDDETNNREHVGFVRENEDACVYRLLSAACGQRDQNGRQSDKDKDKDDEWIHLAGTFLVVNGQRMDLPPTRATPRQDSSKCPRNGVRASFHRCPGNVGHRVNAAACLAGL
jgi:hypothetical protein